MSVWRRLPCWRGEDTVLLRPDRRIFPGAGVGEVVALG